MKTWTFPGSEAEEIDEFTATEQQLLGKKPSKNAKEEEVGFTQRMMEAHRWHMKKLDQPPGCFACKRGGFCRRWAREVTQMLVRKVVERVAGFVAKWHFEAFSVA